MNLFVNTLMSWETGEIERVLRLDNTAVITIEVRNKKALPQSRWRTDVEAALAQGQFQILETDGFIRLNASEAQLTEKERQYRDEAWEVIRPLVEQDSIFTAHQRGSLVTERSAQIGKRKTTIYGYLRRYWQCGQTPNALLPEFYARGGRGKNKADSGRKRGSPNSSGLASGVNVNDHIRECFRKGIRQFYETGEGHTLREAYQRTLERYFNRGHEWREGVLVPILLPVEELPTLRQFSYWYHKERDLTRTLVKREGQNRFNTQYRPVLGDSTGMAFGPGSVYQIDATDGDIYLVSSLDPQRIIGRPVIYLVVDVFSRMLVGVSVTLEGPSWLGAMRALENATSSKVAFCQQHGVTISAEDWPCQHLPEMLLADRGELEGYNADNLVNELNITVSNTAPYRADMKGIVEQYFRLTNKRIIDDLPGAVEERGRGEDDYRLEARLNLEQLTYLLIQGALSYNRHHRVEDYPLDKVMVADGVEPYPLDLWRWGIRNRSGHLRTQSVDKVRFSLLPRDTATVTQHGIRFRKLFYTCERAVDEGWYVKAGYSGRWKVSVSYDPRTTDWLYLWHDKGQPPEPCSLVENSRMALFRGLDWDTADAYFKLQVSQKQVSANRERQARATLNAHKEAVVRAANENAPDNNPTQSKQARVSNIRANRQAERDQERQANAWRLATSDSPDSDEAVDDSAYIPPAQYLDLLE
jgi:putative transposase